MHATGGWWTQAVAVGYERLRGQRARYAQADGTYTVSVTKTLDAGPAQVFECVANDRARSAWAPVALEVRSKSRARVVRFHYENGAKIDAYLQPKSKGRSALTIVVAKLHSEREAEAAKKRWRAGLEKLAKDMRRA
jgi:hypothetical protein